MPAQDVSVSATFEEGPIPYADGTITFDPTYSYRFTDYGRSTVRQSNAGTVNKTLSEQIVGGTNQAGAAYYPFSNKYKAKGTNIKVSYDVCFENNGADKISSVSLRGNADTKAATDASDTRNNNSTGRLFSIYMNAGTLSIFTAETDTASGVASDGEKIENALGNWYHVEATVNATAKTSDIKVYAYKENNNYIVNAPVLASKIGSFRDNGMDGVAGFDIFSDKSYLSIDNIYVYDETYDALPVTVTAPSASDGTLKVNENRAKADDVITITATPAEGKKVSKYVINGQQYDATNNTYQYTVKAEDEKVEVSAIFVRADVTEIQISAEEDYVQKGKTTKLTAVVKANTTELSGDDAKVTWKVEPGTAETKADGTTISDDGTLTLADDQAAGTLTVTASIKKDITGDGSAENTVTSNELTINVTDEPVFKLAKELKPEEGGIVTLKVNDVESAIVKQSESVTVEVEPNDGFALDKIGYRKTSEPEGEITDVTSSRTIAGSALTEDTTVVVEFKAAEYDITCETENVTVLVDGEEKNKATVGQTIAVIGQEGYRVTSITAKKTVGDDTVSDEHNYFSMPAANVTITAVTESSWNGIYATTNFDGQTEDLSLSSTNHSEVTNGAKDVGTWTIGGSGSSSGTYTKDATTKSEFTKGSGKIFNSTGENAQSYIDVKDGSGNNISTTSDYRYKASFDVYFTTAGVSDTMITIGKNTQWSDLSSAMMQLVACPITYNTVIGDTCESNKIYYYDFDSKTYKPTDIATPAVLTVEVTVDNNGRTELKLNGDKTYTYTSTYTGFERMFLQGARFANGSKGKQDFYVDNILIGAPWATREAE